MKLPGKLCELMRAVSRSFAISLSALPPKVRNPVALGYMLARASDTVADADAPVDDEERLQTLKELKEAIAGLSLPDSINSQSPAPTRTVGFAGYLTNRREQQLLRQIPMLMTYARLLPLSWRCELSGVLCKIIEGQQGDVITFPRQQSGFRALPDADALHRYTYMVAGCVGGFWTRLCLDAIPGYARVSPRRLVDDAVRFGCGLQLVNILRDRPEDLAKNRCYLPVCTGGNMPTEDVLLRESVFWYESARQQLKAGERYSAGIRGVRTRFAVLLPVLIGMRTLRLIEVAGAQAFRERLKVSRPEVRRLIFLALLRAGWPPALRESAV